MSRSRRDVDFILDIQDAILRILDYTAALDWENYLGDYKTQDAVVRNLEIIGEAAKNISLKLRQEYSAIPWKMMAGTRDRLMHQYFGVNQEIVWQIVQSDLPALLQQISTVLSVIDNEDIDEEDL
jgi:uncharacterized protein with HEPN domain